MFGDGRFGRFSWIGVVFGAATVIATASDLHAERPPLWSSGPAILATDTTGGLSQTTKIIGFAPHGSNPDPFIVANDSCGTNPQWWLVVCDGFVHIPDTDGDPAAAYAGITNNQFWICGHSASTGHIYCQRGSLHPSACGAQRQPPLYGSDEGGLGQVGNAIFGPSPALVRMLNVQNTWFVWLFAQGSNGQIWSTARPDNGIWGSWSQLPTFPGGFSSPPAATAYASGRIIVCARQLSNYKYACTHQDFFGPFGSLIWSSWTEVPSSYQYGTKPALATSNSSIYLFGIDIGGSQNEIVNFLPLGGGTWSANAVVGGGWGFSAGPAAIGISYGAGIGPNVLTVGRGGDTAYYWDSGSSSGWNFNWTPIQVAN